jgi:hypothetical protein
MEEKKCNHEISKFISEQKENCKQPIVNDFGDVIEVNKYYEIQSGCSNPKTAKYLEPIYFWKVGAYDVNFLDSNYQVVMEEGCISHHWTKVSQENFKKMKLISCYVPPDKIPKFEIKGDLTSLC